MQDIHIDATPTSPEVDFRFSEHRLSLKGESYPENAAAFYGPLLEALKEYLETVRPASMDMTVSLLYFNSSSTKALFTLFEQLHDAALHGLQVHLYWQYDEDDDTILEFGDDLNEDFPALHYHAVAITA